MNKDGKVYEKVRLYNEGDNKVEEVVNYYTGVKTKKINGEEFEKRTFSVNSGSICIKVETQSGYPTTYLLEQHEGDETPLIDDFYDFDSKSVKEKSVEYKIDGQDMVLTLRYNEPIDPIEGENLDNLPNNDYSNGYYTYIQRRKNYSSPDELITYALKEFPNDIMSADLTNVNSQVVEGANVISYSRALDGTTVERIAKTKDNYIYRITTNNGKIVLDKYNIENVSDLQNAISENTVSHLETVPLTEDDKKISLGVVNVESLNGDSPVNSMAYVHNYMLNLAGLTSQDSSEAFYLNYGDRTVSFAQTQDEKQSMAWLFEQYNKKDRTFMTESSNDYHNYNGNYLTSEGELVYNEGKYTHTYIKSYNGGNINRAGVTLFVNEDSGETLYRITSDEDVRGVHTYYNYKKDGTFDHMTVQSDTNPSVSKLVYPDGSTTIYKRDDDGSVIINSYDSEGNETFFEY